MLKLVDLEAVNVAILMVTYGKDLPFAEFSFKSVQKFASGFGERVVVVPNWDVEAFRAVAEPCGFRVVGFNERPKKGMLHHQVMILQADELCPQADAILHLDADCLFTAPVTPADYLDGDRPILFRQKYESFKNCHARYSWKTCVRNATGIDPEWETMCRHPSVYLRDTYALTRQFILEHVQMDWEEYVLSCRNEYPQTFAEFPTLGAVAIHATPDRYSYVHVGHADDATNLHGISPPQPAPKLIAMWSHGGLDMVNDRHPGRTARQVIAEVLGE